MKILSFRLTRVTSVKQKREVTVSLTFTENKSFLLKNPKGSWQ